MAKISKSVFYSIVFICICLVAVFTVFATNSFETPFIIDIYDDRHYEQPETNKHVNTNAQPEEPDKNDNSVVVSTTNTEIDVNAIPSVLTIRLSGNNLIAFNKATKTLPADDHYSRILIKIALQLLESNTLVFEQADHYYSLSFKKSGYQINAKTYNLKNCITRINQGQYVYCDNFGFLRLAHSIACYTINKSNPELVKGLSGLYGQKGTYSEGITFNAMKSLKSGAVIYDCLTGPKTGERYVAMFLYTNGTEVVFLDHCGIHTGQFQNNSYIYSSISSPAYKFNKFKNYC